MKHNGKHTHEDHTDPTRREMLQRSVMGLAMVGGVGVTGLRLRADAGTTASSGDLGNYGDYVEAESVKRAADAEVVALNRKPAKWAPTEKNIMGPYYRSGAPFRGKVTPPLAEGVTMLIGGQVWSAMTRKPLAGATLDIWQANHHGRYDNDDPKQPPAKDVFLYRVRLVTDESGYYEYETIMPGRYQIGRNLWRPAHIHYYVRDTANQQHRELVTQLYFEGDPFNEKDRFIKKSLIIKTEKVAVGKQHYLKGQFDIVLAGKRR